MIKFIRLLSLSATYFACTFAHAQYWVIDPANIAQNTITAAYAAAQEIREGKRVLQDLANISADLKNAQGILASAAGVQDVMDMIKVTTKLKGELEQMGSVANTFKDLYGASNAKSPQEFLMLMKRREAAGDSSVTALMDNAKELQKKLERTKDQHQQLADSLPGIEGMTQAAISTTAAVGIVIQQNQAMLSNYQDLNINQAAAVAKQNAIENEIQKRMLNYKNEMDRRLTIK